MNCQNGTIYAITTICVNEVHELYNGDGNGAMNGVETRLK